MTLRQQRRAREIASRSEAAQQQVKTAASPQSPGGQAPGARGETRTPKRGSSCSGARCQPGRGAGDPVPTCGCSTSSTTQTTRPSGIASPPRLLLVPVRAARVAPGSGHIGSLGTPRRLVFYSVVDMFRSLPGCLQARRRARCPTHSRLSRTGGREPSPSSPAAAGRESRTLPCYATRQQRSAPFVRDLLPHARLPGVKPSSASKQTLKPSCSLAASCSPLPSHVVQQSAASAAPRGAPRQRDEPILLAAGSKGTPRAGAPPSAPFRYSEQHSTALLEAGTGNLSAVHCAALPPARQRQPPTPCATDPAKLPVGGKAQFKDTHRPAGSGYPYFPGSMLPLKSMGHFIPRAPPSSTTARLRSCPLPQKGSYMLLLTGNAGLLQVLISTAQGRALFKCHKIALAVLRGKAPVSGDYEEARLLLRQREDSFRRDLQWVLFNKYVPSLIQDGPQCGLVALWMAGHLLQMPTPLPLEQIVARALGRGYTAQGEMFSAQAMALLAEELYGCVAELLSGGLRGENETRVIGHLAAGQPLLVPYDEDFNHEPCLRNGQRAHWAVVSGVLLGVARGTDTGQLQHDPQLPWLLLPRASGAPWLPRQGVEEVHLLAKQGKSLRYQLWALERLRDSNGQLCQLDPQRAQDGTRYVLPPGGVGAGLAGQVVLLHRRDRAAAGASGSPHLRPQREPETEVPDAPGQSPERAEQSQSRAG
ncbi:CS054 protein, partial [Atractosteus spatula]|nr:CS054 protein [Atractosteus spatula]